MRLALRGPAHVLGLQFVRDANVQIATVLLVGFAAQASLDALAGLDGKYVWKVEDCLLPVCVLCVWTCGELYWLVACAEFNVKPGDHGVYVVGAANGKVEGDVKRQICDGALVQVEGEDRCWVCYDGFHVDCVDEWLGQCGVLQR